MDEELVILVQQHPALYDLSHKDYDNHSAKENMWKEIGATLKKTAKECKSKWALLRSYYIKARGRRRTASGQSALKVKKWRLEDQMEFLIPFLQDRTTQSNAEIRELDVFNAQWSNMAGTEPDVKLEIDSDLERGSDSSTTPHSPSTSAVKPRYAESQQSTTRSQLEPGLEQTLRAFISSGTSGETSAVKKALMVFFDDIAESMLKFSDRERAEIKRDIFRIVNDKEIEKLTQSEGNVLK